jgi:hypothetical protein
LVSLAEQGLEKRLELLGFVQSLAQGVGFSQTKTLAFAPELFQRRDLGFDLAELQCGFGRALSPIQGLGRARKPFGLQYGFKFGVG